MSLVNYVKPVKVGEMVAIAARNLSVQNLKNGQGFQAVKTSPTKRVRMTKRQVQILQDANSPESLKTLIKKVTELQSSKKFGNLIQNNVPKPDAVLRGPQKQQKSTSAKDRNSNDSLAIASKELKNGIHKGTAQPLISKPVEPSNIQNVQLYSAARPRLLENLVQYLRSFWWSVMPKIVRPKGKGKSLWSQGFAGIRNKSDHVGFQLPKDLPTAVSLFTFRVGLCKSSNVDTMRPVKNWICLQPQRFLHGTTPMYQQPRLFSTTAPLRAKDSGKDCKRKGGSLPCLTPVGIVKKDKGKSSNKICEKFCMPCCAPARDPPECVVAQNKRECKKFKAPRPAFSECKKDKLQRLKPCECTLNRQPPCGLESSSGGSKCG